MRVARVRDRPCRHRRLCLQTHPVGERHAGSGRYADVHLGLAHPLSGVLFLSPLRENSQTCELVVFSGHPGVAEKPQTRQPTFLKSAVLQICE